MAPFGALTVTPVKVVDVVPVYEACIDSLISKWPVLGNPVVEETVIVVDEKDPPVNRGVNPVPTELRAEESPALYPLCAKRRPAWISLPLFVMVIPVTALLFLERLPNTFLRMTSPNTRIFALPTPDFSNVILC